MWGKTFINYLLFTYSLLYPVTYDLGAHNLPLRLSSLVGLSCPQSM